ncbi:hypothetical protein ACN20G_14035 [Streptomyces sp. BI20]|uniref:hypothetical protein n=1 Tax=Streptomyces sp. BI20 TaxID=3403460 RepID=UPI003C785E9B
MGSLRNPVGPLPSTIYWRRRAILASVAALLALLITWLVSSSGGSGDQDGKNADGGPAPVASITPGAPGKGPAISQAPGGRDESGGGGSGGSSGTGAGAGGDTGSTGGAGTGGSGGGAADEIDPGVVAADRVPANHPLPTCLASSVDWEVRSVKNDYEPNERPKLELLVRNKSASPCKFDLGPKHAVVTILRAGSGGAEDAKAVWSSDHCPKNPVQLFLKVAGNAETKRTLDWDRTPSTADRCTGPSPSPLPAGDADTTYLVEVKAGGMPVARTSFVLKKD